MSEGPFSRKATIRLAVVLGLSLAAFVFVTAWGFEPEGGTSSGADALSPSAVGYAKFVRLLQELDVPATVSRFSSGRRAGDRAALVVTAPRLAGPDDRKRLEEMLGEARAALLVLPKWRWEPSREKRGRVDAVWEVGPYEVRKVLEAAGIEGTPVRISAEAAHWQPDASFPEAPTLPFPQLLVSGHLRPLIAAEGRILLGEVYGGDRRILVLSDPDLISNFGIGRGDNAVVAARIVDELRAGEMPVLVDVTVNGWSSPPSVWRELFRFPLLLAVLQGCLVLSLVLWVATGRFGSPPPEGPAIEPGKGVLIDNTARLLAFGGHSREALRRYFRSTREEVAQTFHAPAELSREGLARFLDRLSERRGTTTRYAKLAEEVRDLRGSRSRETGQILRTAARIHAFRREILHGSREHPRRD